MVAAMSTMVERLSPDLGKRRCSRPEFLLGLLNGPFYSDTWRLNYPSMTHGETIWIQGSKPTSALERGRLVPGSQCREGKERLDCTGDRGATGSLEGIARDQGAVTLIEERNVTWSVSGGRDYHERSNSITILQEVGRTGLDGGVGATQLALRFIPVEGAFPGQEARVADRGKQLRLRQSSVQRIGRADVVHVGVGEDDPKDRRAHLASRRLDCPGAPGYGRVDQREAVVLAHQVSVDREDVGEASELGG